MNIIELIEKIQQAEEKLKLDSIDPKDVEIVLMASEDGVLEVASAELEEDEDAVTFVINGV